MNKFEKNEKKSITPQKETIRTHSIEELLKLGKERNSMDFAKNQDRKQ